MYSRPHAAKARGIEFFVSGSGLGGIGGFVQVRAIRVGDCFGFPFYLLSTGAAEAPKLSSLGFQATSLAR